MSTFLINSSWFSYLNVEATPLWLKSGTYVEFRSERNAFTLIEFINNSELLYEDLGSGLKGKTLFILRWECLSLNDSVAELEIAVKLVLVEDNRSFEMFTRVFVDVNSRDVYSVNGTPCGKTMLWLPTNLEVGDKVVFGYPECYVEGTVTDKEYYIETPSYGYQKCFEVKFDRQPVKILYKNETYTHTLWNLLNYDLDTGILIETPRLMGEGSLYALGIFQIASEMLIYDTNVDLGPGLIWPEMLDVLWAVPPILFFVFVFFVVYWRRRKRRRIARRRGK